MARGSADGPTSPRTGGGLLGRLRGGPRPLPSLGGIAGRAGRTDPSRVRFTKQDVQRLNQRFALLDRSERREIMRAVNRGVGMERRRDAEIAIGVARRQQRFWSRAWLLGPAIALGQALITPIGWLEGLLLAAWGTLLLGMMSAWWWSRARRSLQANLRVVGRESGGPRPSEGGPTRRSRLPGGPPVAPRSALDEDDEGGAPNSVEASPRPPRPRGRKRR